MTSLSNGKPYSSQTYSGAILEGFAQLRANAALCDVTLCAEGKTYEAHRGLLAAASDYFRGNLFVINVMQQFFISAH